MKTSFHSLTKTTTAKKQQQQKKLPAFGKIFIWRKYIRTAGDCKYSAHRIYLKRFLKCIWQVERGYKERSWKHAWKGRELDSPTPEQRALFGELDPAPVCFLQLVDKRYPLKAVRILVIKEKWKKKNIPFRQNLLRSIRPFPEPIQFFLLGASLSYGKPPKRGRINQRRNYQKNWIWRGPTLFLTASQTHFALGDLISGSPASCTSPCFFEVCEQVLKGIVYTLAVKSTQVLDLVYQKERVALV